MGETVERRLELLDPLVDGNVERSQRARRHHARRRQAVAGLEALDALDHGVVMRAGVLVAGDVAAHQQPLAQEIVMRALLAEGEFGVCGNGWRIR